MTPAAPTSSQCPSPDPELAPLLHRRSFSGSTTERVNQAVQRAFRPDSPLFVEGTEAESQLSNEVQGLQRQWLGI